MMLMCENVPALFYLNENVRTDQNFNELLHKYFQQNYFKNFEVMNFEADDDIYLQRSLAKRASELFAH